MERITIQRLQKKAWQPLNNLTLSFHLQNAANPIIVGSGSFQFSHCFNTHFSEQKKHINVSHYSFIQKILKTVLAFPKHIRCVSWKEYLSCSYFRFHSIVHFSLVQAFYARFFHSKISIIFICFLFPRYIFHSSVFVENIRKFI